MTTNTTIAHKVARRKLSLLKLASDMAKARGPKDPHSNRVSEELEQAVLQYSLKFPTHGSLKVSQQLHLKGKVVGSGAVRGVWQRLSILSKHQRLLRRV